MHKNPILSGLVSIGLFILFNVGAIIWVLKQTAAENGYGKQLVNSLLVGVIAGVLIFVLSWIQLSFLFPDALAEMREGYVATMENAGMPQAQMDAAIAQMEGTTAASQSASGMIGTFITSLIVGAVTAIFLRKK